MKVRELIEKIRDFDGIEIRDFETNKRLAKVSKKLKNIWIVKLKTTIIMIL